MKRNYGPFLIMIAASLWAVDACCAVRHQDYPPMIVFLEHLIDFDIEPAFLKYIQV